ncbi:outer membrane lipoprotein-sorting protein [candidate division KSB1 bacterium]|nr:outer membrane lipoprotein-sorting protein [candidate division KSB1 bacterium]
MKLFCVLLASLTLVARAEMSTREIVERAQLAMKVQGLQGVNTMIIYDEKGRERVRKIAQMAKLYDNGKTEKRLIRFLEPADIKGTALLTFDYEEQEDDLWLYMPALRKTRRIVRSEKARNFMGSEFTYADMTPPSLNDFTFHKLDDQEVNGVSCYQIEWKPADDARAEENGFNRRITFIAKDDFVVRKSIYYDLDGDLHKELTIAGVIELDSVHKRYRALEMEMVNHQNGRRSIIKSDKLEFTPHINDEYFTTRYLERE